VNQSDACSVVHILHSIIILITPVLPPPPCPPLDGSLMDEVLQLMLAVVSFDPSDAEGQVVLGVLQNVTQDLQAATGAFQKALQQNPQDFSLLNKVSASCDVM
jgi:hypothetical protein